jgi:hypothetical protein
LQIEIEDNQKAGKSKRSIHQGISTGQNGFDIFLAICIRLDWDLGIVM